MVFTKSWPPLKKNQVYKSYYIFPKLLSFFQAQNLTDYLENPLLSYKLHLHLHEKGEDKIGELWRKSIQEKGTLKKEG